MKISKKIFGVALALIMIFNVFAVGTSADFASGDTAIQLIVKTDKTVYAPGDEIVITFAENVGSELTSMMIGGGYDMAYNSEALEFLVTTPQVAGHNFVAHQPGAIESICGIKVISDTTTIAANPYGLDAGFLCNISDDGSTTFDSRGGVDLFSFTAKIPADCPDGTYYIMYNADGYDAFAGYRNDGLGFGGMYSTIAPTEYGFSYANTFEYGVCSYTVSSKPAVEVTHIGEQAKWNGGNANNTAENYLFGFVGQVTGLEVTTEAQDGHNVVTNIQSIVATASYNATTVTSEVITMWAVDGGYQFRAVFAGFDPADTKEVSVTFAITMSDGTTQYTTASASVDTPNAIYNAAVSRGMPALAA